MYEVGTVEESRESSLGRLRGGLSSSNEIPPEKHQYSRFWHAKHYSLTW